MFHCRESRYLPRANFSRGRSNWVQFFPNTIYCRESLPRALNPSTLCTIDAMYHRRFEGFDPGNYQRGWSRSWRSLRKAAGLQWAEFYCLRHTFITAAAESDVPLSVTKAMV